MDYQSLIPFADTIPAPAWVFIVLEQLLFLLHILLVNAVLGGAIIVLFKRFSGNDASAEQSLPVAKKLPVMVALAINLAVPPPAIPAGGVRTPVLYQFSADGGLLDHHYSLTDPRLLRNLHPRRQICQIATFLETGTVNGHCAHPVCGIYARGQ